ncbi:MAG: ATP-binding protein [Thermodesulfovibrionales bacterium]|jgi:two-component system nitrogen regulation sensor histidine kinase NtrY
MKIPRGLLIAPLLLAVVIALTIAEIRFIRLPSVDLQTRIILIGLLTLNVVALFTLIFFVAKNIYKLFMERRQKIPGYRFRTKLMAVFVLLTLIPSAFLFIVSSGLASNIINRVLSPQMKEPLDKSIELARAFYDLERKRAVLLAQQVTRGESSLSPDRSVSWLTTLPPDATDAVRDAFQGKTGTEVISSSKGDIIRAAVPDPSSGRVVVVEISLPREISGMAGRMRELYEEYLKIEAFKEPLRLNYMLILGFLTLLMVFAALWLSLKISREITVPIQSLAIATEKVASGRLDTQVAITSNDELGLLISSFNQRVQQLRESKKSIERAYRESDRRRVIIEGIVENIDSGVIFLSNGGKILAMNRAAASILTVDPEVATGKDYREFVSGLNSPDLLEMVQEMEGKEVRGIKREIKVSTGGKALTISVYITGIRESLTASYMGILVVFDDITEIIKAQKALAWQEVARRLAHEIKNPLTPIKLSTERLIKKWQQKEPDLDAVFEKSTRTIIAEVESIRRLVDEFAQYGRMPEIQKSATEIRGLMDDLVSLYKGFRAVEIRLSLPEGISPVYLDPEQFRRVLVNIMDNAIKAMNARGVIDISVGIQENRLAVAIADTGPGIKDEEKEKLFIPYFSRRKGGTGLGLAIAGKIVHDHGGIITVRNNTPTGSIFTVEIPVQAG